MKKMIKASDDTKSGFKSGDRYLGGLPAEPSAQEYGKAMDQARRGAQQFLLDNDIELTKKNLSFTDTLYTYTGEIEGTPFTYVEMHSNFSRYAKSLSYGGREVDLYKTTPAGSWSTLSSKSSIYSVVRLLQKVESTGDESLISFR